MRASLRKNSAAARRSARHVEPAPKSPWSVSSVVTLFALLITVSTLFLTLLGYGHDMAYLEQFGLYSEELQRSALDFLLRAWRPFIDAVLQWGSRPKWSVVMTFYRDLLRYNLWWLTVIALIWMLVFPRRKKLGDRVAATRTRVSQSAWSASALRIFHAERGRFAGWAALPIFFAAATFLLLILAAVWFSALLWFAAIPSWGVDSGTARARKDVINAVACRSTAQPDGARCLSVSRDDVDLAKGILIDYGAGRVYLYQPCDGTVLALTLERTVIRSFSAGKNDRFFQRPCSREQGSTN